MEDLDNSLKGKSKLWSQSAIAVCYKKDSIDLYDYHTHSKGPCSYSDRIRQRTCRVQRSTRNIIKTLVWRFYPCAHSCRREPGEEGHCKVKHRYIFLFWAISVNLFKPGYIPRKSVPVPIKINLERKLI